MHVRHWPRCVLLSFMFLALALFVACGGSSDGPSGPAQPIPVSGKFVKGPVAGATITLHAMTTAGTPGAVRGGPFTTDASGEWSGELTAGTSGPFLIVATGGSFVDEASAATVQVGATQFLGYSSTGSGIVTPFTQALAAAAQARGGSASAAWASVITSFETAFGFDPTATTPALGGGTDGQTYFALLGGLSNLLDSNPALSGLASAETIELVRALATDIADGKLDGLDASGASIAVSTGGGMTNWPALDASGIGALIDAVNSWAATVAGLEEFSLDPTDLDFNPGGSGTGSGSLTFSGPAAALLASSSFVPIGFSANEGALAWSASIGTNSLVSIGVGRSTTDPSRATLATVTSTDGATSYGWSLFAFENGVAGITVDGNTVTFDNVTLPATVGTQLALTISGQLGE